MVGGELVGQTEVNGSAQSAAYNSELSPSPISSRRIQEPEGTPSPSTSVPTFRLKHAENEGVNGGKESSVFFYTLNQGATFLPETPANQLANAG